MEEQQLIQQLKAKNERAFEYLVEQYKDRVFNTLIGLLQNREEAEDLSQEVFMDIWQHVHQFKEASALSTWIYQICINRFRDYLKWKKRKKRFAFITSLYDSESEAPILHPPDFVHPGVVLERKEDAAVLFQAIRQLPEQQQLAYVLNKLEGLSYQEIAAVLDKSQGSIESLLHRAKQNLKRILYAYYKQE